MKLLKILVTLLLVISVGVGCDSPSSSTGEEMEEEEEEQTTDTTPPEVASTTPEDGEMDIATDDFEVTIKMSEEVNPSSVNSDNIWVENAREGQNVELDYSTNKKVITLTLPGEGIDSEGSEEESELVSPATEYLVHVESLEDTAGNVMQGSYESKFGTELWTVESKYSSSAGFSSTYATESTLYFSGVFEREDGFSSFYVGKFSQDGLLEWFTVLPGKTEIKLFGPKVTSNENRNEVYVFSEKDKEVYFNCIDSNTGELLTEKLISEGDYGLIREKSISVDNNGNIYFFVEDLDNTGRYIINELWKTDTNGNLVDKLDFVEYSVSDIATNGDTMFAIGVHNEEVTVAQINIQSMEFELLIRPDKGDVFPDGQNGNFAIEMNPGERDVYVIGDYQDTPAITVFDIETHDHTSIQFGDVFDDVENAVIDKSGNVYTLLDDSEKVEIAKVSVNDGLQWRSEIDMEDILPPTLSVSEEMGKVFGTDLFSDTFQILETSTGNKLN